MKITVAQLNYHIGNISKNVESILDAIAVAKKDKSDMIIFSELSLTGYPPIGYLESKEFISSCNNLIARIASACNNIVAIVGVPIQKQGKLYNSALVLSNGKIIFSTSKSRLDSDDYFNDNRYFAPLHSLKLFNFKGRRIAITIGGELNTDFRYKLSALNPELIININSEAFKHNTIPKRVKYIQRRARLFGVPMIYVNQAGASADLIFEGASMVLNANGDIVKQLPYFETSIQSFVLSEILNPIFLPLYERKPIKLIYQALITALRDYFLKTGQKRTVVGLSGGLDSAIVVSLAVEALGKDNVRAVLMPSRYSSEHSITDSVQLAQNLNIRYDIVNIEEIVSAIEHTMSPLFEGCFVDITEENIQARSRAIILMAISNKFGDMVLNTSNKSEAAVGYSTLYGDMAGGLSIIGDIYKTEAYKLAEYINRKQEIIPINIVNKAPSAELRPDQLDIDSLPPYDQLDSILYKYIELGKSSSQIIAEGAEEKVVERVIKLVRSNEYKRYQMPPVLRVSSLPLGNGRRYPIV